MRLLSAILTIANQDHPRGAEPGAFAALGAPLLGVLQTKVPAKDLPLASKVRGRGTRDGCSSSCLDDVVVEVLLQGKVDDGNLRHRLIRGDRLSSESLLVHSAGGLGLTAEVPKLDEPEIAVDLGLPPCQPPEAAPAIESPLSLNDSEVATRLRTHKVPSKLVVHPAEGLQASTADRLVRTVHLPQRLGAAGGGQLQYVSMVGGLLAR
mmetsp:Transcript_15622/g.59368  ORF Transcript_15622/g.59368 Transcript_15622/m.59368 type:complete len:208 (-) Transcript_15622:1149-1772(-)